MLAICAVAAVACGRPEDDTAGPANCAREQADYGLTWNNWGQGFFLTYCSSCHSADSPNRFGATEGVDFDTFEDLQGQVSRVRYRVLEEETMPLGGGVSPDDLFLLDAFLACSVE